MNVWLWAALALLTALIPCVVTCLRGELVDRLIGLEMAGVIVTLELILLAQGFHRSFFYDLPLMLAFLSFGGGMAFARFVERWL
ncbi:MAG TPA: MrpF/PhaF family protein [Pirellulales bacterium]|jgi:multicomponent Na+:H+ antiporter subunit F|nr:MrpF/PhaF family protein [Pirellulales bacterium]